MTELHVYQSECEWWVGASVDDVTRTRDEAWGFNAEDSADDPFTAVDDDKLFVMSFPDGDDETTDRAYPAWVDAEPEASVERLPSGIAKVQAPARVWARRSGPGPLASTEY